MRGAAKRIFPPGEEAQVDYGHGAPTLTANGKYKRPYLFVMTLKFSGKSFRKVVWKTSQEIWAQLHEDAWRAFGGCCQYAVLDNLKEGVLRPDIYAPELNPVYGALLAHYGVVADPCRVGDPNRKGTVESAIQHTQSTALKGRQFESIETQNAWLAALGIGLTGIYGFGVIVRPNRCRARLGPDSILALVVFVIGIVGLFFVAPV